MDSENSKNSESTSSLTKEDIQITLAVQHSDCSTKITPNLITKFNPDEKIFHMSSEFEEKVKEFSKNPKKLAIITDFDFTLTKKYHDESNLYSSYAVLESSEHLSEDFKKINKDLFLKYSKFETDLTLDFHTRDELMQTWFRENLDLIVDQKLSKENFASMIIQAEKRFYYRYGILELFELVRKYEIPIFIISAGLYEIISESIKIILPYFDELLEKKLIHILANKFIYDSNNVVCGYEEPFVYTFNKGDVLKKIYHDYKTSEGNLIVMGDHLNDVDSIKHIDYNEEIKIGFINYFEDTLMEQHTKMIEAFQLKYDMSLINDGNLTFVNNLIQKIMTGEEKEKKNK